MAFVWLSHILPEMSPGAQRRTEALVGRHRLFIKARSEDRLMPLTFGGTTAADADFSAFYEWAVQCAGVRAVGCAPAEVAEGWRGVCATGYIAPGDVVLRVPGRYLMSSRTALDDPDLARALASPEGLRLLPSDRLGVHLLHEASKGEASRWCPYIQQLPRRYNVMASWSKRERAMLQAPFAIDAAKRSHDDVERAWTRVTPVLRALKMTVGFCGMGAWQWAHASVSSRTVFVPFDAAGALCPVGDLFNYAPPHPPHAPRIIGEPFGSSGSGSGGSTSGGSGGCLLDEGRQRNTTRPISSGMSGGSSGNSGSGSESSPGSGTPRHYNREESGREGSANTISENMTGAGREASLVHGDTGGSPGLLNPKR